ncbi:MAG: hypothetical protein VW455_04530 [Nitrospinota bacterium]
MNAIKPSIYFIVFLLTAVTPQKVSAQLFGSDEENWKKVFISLKKINVRLSNLETQEMASLRTQLEDLLRQIEEVKQTLPQLQGAVELNKSESLAKANKLESKLSDLEAEVKNQVLLKISQQNKILDNIKQAQRNLKEGLAQDMEQFEKVNKENFQSLASVNKNTLETVAQSMASLDETSKKNFEDTRGLFISDVIPAMAKENEENRKVILQQLATARETNDKALESLSNKNQKLIEILGENLIQGADTKAQVESIGKNVTTVNKNLAAINKSLTATNKNITVNNKNLMVADEKINKLAETLKALQKQNSVSGETLVALKGTLDKAQEFDQLEDEKINKLIETSSQLTAHANKLEKSVINELRQSAQKEDSNLDKIDLANEKLSRLIEILKAIATEQDKLGQFVKVQSGLNKAQKGLSKAQEGIIKNQESIKEALADLRRKANVNISRNDDIKKSLGEIKKGSSSVSSNSPKN